MMTKQEAADNLKLGLATLERRLRAVSIPVVTIGRRMLLRWETLGAVHCPHEWLWGPAAATEVTTNEPPAGEG